MKYYQGRDNLACTVFIPVKCGNNCPFCNTKQMYDNFTYSKKYLNRIIKMIKRVNESPYVTEFVITGGEPLFNLSIAKKLVNAMQKPVYINTSLPDIPEIGKAIKWINTEYKIRGLSISRHINYEHDVRVCSRDVVNTITKPVRINTVVTEDQIGNIIAFYDYWRSPSRMINLRADYRTITTDNLKNRDKISEFLLSWFKWEYTNGCLVCNSEVYSNEFDSIICYHKGLEHSCVITMGRYYVNDVLIDMYGNIYKDWDFKEDKEFETWLFND